MQSEPHPHSHLLSLPFQDIRSKASDCLSGYHSHQKLPKSSSDLVLRTRTLLLSVSVNDLIHVRWTSLPWRNRKLYHNWTIRWLDYSWKVVWFSRELTSTLMNHMQVIVILLMQNGTTFAWINQPLWHHYDTIWKWCHPVLYSHWLVIVDYAKQVHTCKRYI